MDNFHIEPRGDIILLRLRRSKYERGLIDYQWVINANNNIRDRIEEFQA